MRKNAEKIDVNFHRTGTLIQRHVLHLLLLQLKDPGARGGGLRYLALTSMSRRLLHRRYDMRRGEENAAWQRCEDRRILRLLEMT